MEQSKKLPRKRRHRLLQLREKSNGCECLRHRKPLTSYEGIAQEGRNSGGRWDPCPDERYHDGYNIIFDAPLQFRFSCFTDTVRPS